MPLPSVPLPCLGPATEKQEILQGAGKWCLRQGACHLPLASGFPGGWDRGARRGHRFPGSPWPPRHLGAHGPTWLLQGGQRCRSWARGPRPVASPACAGTWRLPRPRLQPPLRSPGLLGGQVRLLTLRVSLRGHAGDVRPPGRRAGAGTGTGRPRCPRPSPPATTGLPWLAGTHPGAAGPAENDSAWWHCGSRNGAALESPASPSALCESKKPQRGHGATPASRVGLAPLGCWGSWCVCLWASGGQSECT